MSKQVPVNNIIPDNSLPHYYARLHLDPADAAKLEAGTHRIARIVERRIVIEPTED